MVRCHRYGRNGKQRFHAGSYAFFLSEWGSCFPLQEAPLSSPRFERSKMARAKSFLQSGASVGFAVGSVVVSTLITWYNWRIMFFVLGIAGLILAFCLWCVLRSSARTPLALRCHIHPQRTVASPKAAFVEYYSPPINMANRRLLLLYQYCILGFAVLAAILLGESQRMSMVSMGAWSMLPPALGFCLIFVFGWLLDRYFQGRENT